MLALVFHSVCMDSCACACVSQCFYGLLYLCLCFSVFVWTLVLVLVFLSVFMDSCACHALVFLSVCMESCACACVSQCCMDSCACACVSQCLYGLLCLRLCF